MAEKKMLTLPKMYEWISLVGVIVNVTIMVIVKPTTMVIVNVTTMVVVNVTITHRAKTRSYIFGNVNKKTPEFFFQIVVDYGCDYGCGLISLCCCQ